MARLLRSSPAWLIDVVVLSTLAALLAVLFLSRESVWLDEAFSVKLAEADWATLWEWLSESEANGSLYYALLHLWLELGQSELVVRGLSVVGAVATIPLFYFTALRLFSVSVARSASVLLVVNSFFVYYAQEARMYTLTLFLLVAASYAWIRFLDARSWAWGVAYAICASLAVYAHLFSVYVIGAHYLSLVVRDRRTLPSAVQLGLTSALLVALLGPEVVYLARDQTGQLAWVSAPSLRDFARAALKLAGGGNAPVVIGTLLLLCEAALAARALLTAGWLVRREGVARAWPYAFALLWLAVPMLGSFTLSFTTPMFVDRYLIVSLPALTLLVGAGVASIAARRIRLVAFAAVLVLCLADLAVQYRDRTKQDWREVAAYLDAHAERGDAVMFASAGYRLPLEYYLKRSPLATVALTPVYPPQPWEALHLRDTFPAPDATAIGRRLRRHGRLWLVVTPTLAEGEALGRQRLARAIGLRPAVARVTFAGPISLQLVPLNRPSNR